MQLPPTPLPSWVPLLHNFISPHVIEYQDTIMIKLEEKCYEVKTLDMDAKTSKILYCLVFREGVHQFKSSRVVALS